MTLDILKKQLESTLAEHAQAVALVHKVEGAAQMLQHMIQVEEDKLKGEGSKVTEEVIDKVVDKVVARAKKDLKPKD